MNGIKDDRKDDKVMYELVPPMIFEAIADVMTFGAKKYAKDNWQGVEQERYYAALLRHLFAWKDGETYDQDSGRHHLAHVLTNAAFIYWQDLKLKGKKKLVVTKSL